VDDDLLKLAIGIALSEELGREIARGVRVEVVEKVVQRPAGTTRIIKLRDVEIPGTIVDELGVGVLEELVITSKIDYYGVLVEVDGELLVEAPYSWFSSISQHSEWVDAFKDNDVYVLRLSKVFFSKHIRISVFPAATILAPSHPLRLSEVFAKLSIY